MLHSKYLDLLIEGYRVDPWQPHALLTIELILEVLNIKVLQLCWHGSNLVRKLIVVVVHNNFLPVDHVMQIKFCDFFEG